jgi:alpha-beta hydrolase superfamily lysophospholipase
MARAPAPSLEGVLTRSLLVLRVLTVLLIAMTPLPSDALDVTNPVQPPDEGCDDRLIGYFDAPREVLDCTFRGCAHLCSHPDCATLGFFDPNPQVDCNIGSCFMDCTDANCGRLIPRLRAAAGTRDAKEILIRAALEYYLLLHSDLRPNEPPSRAVAQALADLAVTGRGAYGTFRQLVLREGDLVAPVQQRLAAEFPAHVRVPRDIGGAIRQALRRSYQVAWALRGPTPHRQAHRTVLGWIAVDGEDDPPHRPVNVFSAPFPQRNTTVRVKGVSVETRYVVASRHVTDDYGADIDAIPPDRTLPLIIGDVILFIHGHSSSAEEALLLTGPLFDRAAAEGRPLTVIAMDLPSNGYASMIDHTTIAPPGASSWNTGYPILDFIEDFIAAFVDRLEDEQPGIKRQVLGVIGGSLGGNMTLRLGRRDPARYPWLHSIVSWSPASTWPSWARLVLRPPIIGPSSPAERVALGAVRYAGVEKTRGQMMEEEVNTATSGDSLHGFFHRPPDGRVYQGRYWFRSGFTCALPLLKASHRNVYEVYNALFRRWHWRIAHEQLIFSHWDSDNPDRAIDPDPAVDASAGPARYAQIRSRVLLAAGEGDDAFPAHIFSGTSALARAMTMVNGKALLLKGTGHEIHAESPVFFGNQILDFLFETPPPPFPYFLVPGADF